MIFLFIPVLLEIIGKDGKDYIITNICRFIASVAYSLLLVLVKFLTKDYFLSPYLCLLLLGLFSFVFNFIYYLIYSLLKYNDLSIITNAFDFSELKDGLYFSFYCLGAYISGTLLVILTFLVIVYFSLLFY